MKRIKPWLRALIFALLLAVSASVALDPFRISTQRTRDHQRNFPREKRGSIDVVFVGASNVHAFWQPMLAWTDHGISSYNYSVDSLPILAVRYLLDNARKTQPDALYVIPLNLFKRRTSADTIENIHRVVDYMPASLNKFRMIRSLADAAGLTLSERAELFFPIIRFHSRWDSLKPWSLGVRQADYKSSMTEYFFMRYVEDLSDSFALYDGREDLPGDALDVFLDLLDYLDKTGTRFLFIKMPQAANQSQQGRMNALEDLLAQRGLPCLDLMEEWQEVGINAHLDFYNANHTNIHGSLKVTEYISNYLIGHYPLEDKRGMAGWEEWDRSAADYMELVAAYALPFEAEHARRTDTAVPELTVEKGEDYSVAVDWTRVDGIDGYEIYRKSAGERDMPWQLLAGVGADITDYRDAGLEPSTNYTYTVVPYRVEGGEKLYGSFDATGKHARTSRLKDDESPSSDAGGSSAEDE